MAYVGRTPIVGNFVKLDAIVTSATATYNLLNGGVAYFPQTANNCIVSLNGVIQSPTSAYTISGSTIVFDSALTSADSIDFILVLGDVLAIGTPSDGTVTSAKLASGTVGLFAWQSVQTTGFTAVAARAYPCNTTSAAFTVTLPASPSVGDQVLLLDYAGTWDTNNLTINPNSNKIFGQTSNVIASKDREALSLTYIDSTQGWLPNSGYQESTTGLAIPYSVDFLIIAGGAGGGAGKGSASIQGGGGGGAGGYRNSYSTETSGGGGSSETSLSFSPGTVYTVTVGAGGAGGVGNNAGNGTKGSNGNNSLISGTGLTTITSTGGGGGAITDNVSGNEAQSGGSGGGAGSGGGSGSGGSGTANQGFSGGSNNGANYHAGGGGGASAVGQDGASSNGNGGDGLASSITGSSVTRGGGGGGAGHTSNTVRGLGGSGGGGSSGAPSFVDPGNNGTANTGGGGGGSASNGTASDGGLGGSGVVILRIPTASYSGTTTGSPTVTTDGSDKVIVFNSSGSITG